MRLSRVIPVVLLAAGLILPAGCTGLKTETPGPFPYNSRYG